MHIPRAFCANDGQEMIITKTGGLVEVFNLHGPYYKVSCDIFECRECKATVAMPARHPVAVPRDENYSRFSDVLFQGYVR